MTSSAQRSVAGDFSRSYWRYAFTIVILALVLDLAWYALEFSGRIGLVGGAYSHAGSAFVSLTGFGVWLVVVTIWSSLVAAVAVHYGRGRLLATALVVEVGTALFYLLSYPLLLPLLLAEFGIKYPSVLDTWYGQRIGLSSVGLLAMIHAAWLLLLIALTARRR